MPASRASHVEDVIGQSWGQFTRVLDLWTNLIAKFLIIFGIFSVSLSGISSLPSFADDIGIEIFQEALIKPSFHQFAEIFPVLFIPTLVIVGIICAVSSDVSDLPRAIEECRL